MVAIIHNSRTQTVAHCRTTTADKRKRKKAGSVGIGKRRASVVTTCSTAEYTNRTAPTALAAAVNSVLRVSRQHPYRYLMAATLISTGAMAQAQGFPASINLQDLDGSNGFVINGIDDGDFSGGSVSSAGDINGDGVDDVIIGAPGPFFNSGRAGEGYVVFGGSVVGSGGSLNLSDLNGVNGFVINGLDAGDSFGRSVSSAGDINDDGVDDVIIGASGAAESYVVFGSRDIGNGGSLNLSDLDGVNGFVVNGISLGDRSGFSVSGADDFNGDGVDDIIIGAYRGNSNNANGAGESYVVFGGRDVGTGGLLNLSDLDGANGFVINGIAENDNFGRSVSGAGDINGDGVDDVIIGAPGANPDEPFQLAPYDTGASYVLFGGRDVGSSGSLNVSDLDGVNGFTISGIIEGDEAGRSVSGAGDFNGDGVNDTIIGASGVYGIRQSYVVFGSGVVDTDGSLSLLDLDGDNGFAVNPFNYSDYIGGSVSSAGDINGDGVDDLIIGAPGGDPNDVRNAGENYVIFGGRDVGGGGSLNLSDLDRTNGFVINGIDQYDNSGRSVSSAGDFNGDGVDDVIIGASRADPNGVDSAGESYVVFGALDAPVTPPPEGPDNDQFENARFLDSANKALVSELTLTVKGTTVNATAQSGEPAHFQGGFGLPPGPDNSIWYSWTPDADQVVEVDTTGSAVSTVLVAYTGASLSGLQRIAAGIDNVREVARIRFAVRAGETYHLAVDGYEKISEGNIQLNLRQPRLDPSECTIKGTNGSDSLVGTPGSDVICALDGDDFIKALGGDDIIFAGKGSDFVSADGGNDIVFGEEDDDVITGASGDDVLIGGPGNDQLAGANGNDAVFGGEGADRISGSGGNDELFGESDEDRLIGGTGDDYLDGGSFKDICVDSEGEDTFVSC